MSKFLQFMMLTSLLVSTNAVPAAGGFRGLRGDIPEMENGHDAFPTDPQEALETAVSCLQNSRNKVDDVSCALARKYAYFSPQMKRVYGDIYIRILHYLVLWNEFSEFHLDVCRQELAAIQAGAQEDGVDKTPLSHPVQSFFADKPALLRAAFIQGAQGGDDVQPAPVEHLVPLVMDRLNEFNKTADDRLMKRILAAVRKCIQDAESCQREKLDYFVGELPDIYHNFDKCFVRESGYEKLRIFCNIQSTFPIVFFDRIACDWEDLSSHDLLSPDALEDSDCSHQIMMHVHKVVWSKLSGLTSQTVHPVATPSAPLVRREAALQPVSPTQEEIDRAEVAAQTLLDDEAAIAKQVKPPKKRQAGPSKKPQEQTSYTFEKLSYPMKYELSSSRLFEVYGVTGHGLSACYTAYLISTKGAATVVGSASKVPDGAVILPDGQAKTMWQNAQKKDLAVLAKNAELQRTEVRKAKQDAEKRELEARRAVAAAQTAARGFAAVAAGIVGASDGGALPAPTSEAKSGKKSPNNKKKSGNSKRAASTSPTSPHSQGRMQHVLVPQSGALEEHVTEAHLLRGTMTASGLHANGVSGLLRKLVNSQGRSVVSSIGRIELLTSREELCAMQPEKHCFRITWKVEGGQAKVSDCWPLDWRLDRVMESIDAAARNVCEQLSGPNEDGVAMYLGTPSDLPRGARGICLLTRNDAAGTPVVISAWPVLEDVRTA